MAQALVGQKLFHFPRGLHSFVAVFGFAGLRTSGKPDLVQVPVVCHGDGILAREGQASSLCDDLVDRGRHDDHDRDPYGGDDC